MTWLALLAILPQLAIAMGLGKASRAPMIGSPLRIEIPLLLADGEAPPQAGCTRISPLAGNHELQYFPQHARVLVELRGTPRILIVDPRIVTEPILEFRLSLGCRDDLVREYLLLADPPSEHRSVVSVPVPAHSPQLKPAEPPAATPARREKLPKPVTQPPATAYASLALAAETTLNAMARQRYPSSRSTRDEYRRLMVAANPEFFGNTEHPGAVRLPQGSLLAIPGNLPAVLDDNQPGQSTTERTARKPVTDHLVIGGGKYPLAMSMREALASVTRMEAMMEEQKGIETRIEGGLSAVTEALGATRERFKELEAAQEKNAREQRDLRARMDSVDAKVAQTPGVLDLLLLVVAGGMVGAALLMLQARVKHAALATALPASPENYPTAAPKARRNIPPTTESAGAAQNLPRPAPTGAAPDMGAEKPALTPGVPRVAPGASGMPAQVAPTVPPVVASAAPVRAQVVEFIPPHRPAALPAAAPVAAPKPHSKKELIDLPTVAVAESIGLSGDRAAQINALLPEFTTLDISAWFRAFALLREWPERPAFAALSLKLNAYLNVETPSWDYDVVAATSSVLDIRRLMEKLITLWRVGNHTLTRAFLVDLLTDNRGGTRNGFTEGAANDISDLIGVLDILIANAEEPVAA